MDANLVVGSHHLARQFARMGHQVLHVSTPVSPGHLLFPFNTNYQKRLVLWKNRGRKLSENLYEYVPFSWFSPQMACGLPIPGLNTYRFFSSTLKNLLNKQGMETPDILLMDEPRFAGLLPAIHARHIIYRATDLYAEMKNNQALLAVERAVVQQADALVATSAPVLERIRQASPEKPFLILENGVDYEHFSTPHKEPLEYKTLPHPRAVYAGAVDERFDFNAIEVISNVNPAMVIILIGPASVKVPASILSNPRIIRLGPRPYALLPGYLQHADLGLLPLNSHPANRGRSPMKLYEYAAAGLPVVAAQKPELLRRKDPFVYFYQSSSDIQSSCRQALHGISSPAATIARSHDWKIKIMELQNFIESTAQSQSRHF